MVSSSNLKRHETSMIRGFQKQIRLFVLCSALILVTATAGLAVPMRSRLVVGVRSAQGGHSIPLAEVVIIGPRVKIAYTDHRGLAILTSLPAGTYHGFIEARGFHTLQMPKFAVQPGARTSINVSMAPINALKTIAKVVVRAGPRYLRRTTDGSVAATISGSLAGSLGDGAAATVPDYLAGASALGGIRIDGQQLSDEGFSYNGMPLASAGGIGAHLDPSIFSGADFGGSGINFGGFAPTIAWQTKPLLSGGQEGDSSTWISERGTSGRVGLAFVHADRSQESSLNDNTFQDQSGLTYPHADSGVTHSDFMSVRMPLSGDTVVGLTFLQSRNSADILCRQQILPLPCGYGPGNAAITSESFLAGSFDFPIWDGDVSSQVFVSNTKALTNLGSRVVFGFPLPYVSTSTSKTTGAALTFNLPAFHRNLAALSDSMTNTNTSLEQLGSLFGLPYSAELPISVRLNRLSFNDRYSFDRRWRLSTAGVLASGFGPTVASASARVDFLANRKDAYELSYRTGEPFYPRSRLQIADVGSLQFDCPSHSAWGDGPGNFGAPSSENSYAFNAAHRLGDDVFALHVYRSEITGGYELGFLPASAFPSLYGPTFLQQASALYTSPLACGANSPPLALDNVELLQSVPTGRRVYQGLHLTALLRVGAHVTLQPYVAIDSASVKSFDPSFNPSGSTIVPNMQLPFVPLHRYGINAHIDITPTLQGLVTIQEISRNNPAYLRGFALADAAVRERVGEGVLQFGLQNIFNAGGASFGTLSNARAMPRVAEPPLLIPSLPLRPRALELTFTALLGRRMAGEPISIPMNNHGDAAANSVAFRALPLPSTPPLHPFAALTGSAACTPESLDVTRPLLSGLRAILRKIEQKHVKGNRYPPSFPLRRIGSLYVRYHRFGDSFALELFVASAKRGASGAASRTGIPPLIALMRCSAVHFALSNRDLSKAGGFPLPTAELGATYLLYAPRVGLYLYQSGGAKRHKSEAKAFPLPVTPPTAPFALTSTCPSEVRPLAQHLLSSLAAYVRHIEQNTATGAPDGWKIQRHNAPRGWWLSLQTENAAGIASVEECTHVATSSRAQLGSRGLSGDDWPALNFAPQLGLYVIWEKRGDPNPR